MKKRIGLLAFLLATTGYAEDIFFNESDQEKGLVKLEESVITTTGFETNIREIPSNVTVISSQEIQEKGYTSVEEVLEKIPSVTITKGTFGSTVDLRGQGSDKARSNVKILVDGVSIVPLNKTHTRIPLDSIDLNTVETIEVIPGGGAVLYGTGTAGGVINIITKSGSGMKPTNRVNFEIGSHGRERISTSAGALLTENLLLQTNIAYEEGDSYLDEKNQELVSADILAKYKISNKSDVTLKFEKSKDKSQDPGGMLTKEEYDEDRQQIGSSASVNQNTEINRDMVTAIYNQELSDSFRFSLQGTYQRKNDRFSSDNGNKSVQFLDNEIKEEQVDIKPKLQWRYGENSSLVMGFDYSYLKSSRDIEGVGSRNQNALDKRASESYSIYALNSYKLNKIELIQGVRYNQTENKYETRNRLNPIRSTPESTDTMDNMAYELALNYLYSDTGNSYIRWERGFNTPSPTSIFNNPNNSQIANGFEYGLSGVKDETYDSFEIGMRDYFMFSYISLAAFYSETTDEIYREGNSANWVSYNLDETRRKGIELSFEQYLGKFTLSEGYSYIDAEITKGNYKGKNVPGVSKNSFHLSAKYDFNPKVNTILSTVYKDAIYVDSKNTGGKVNDYIVTNLIVNYKVNDAMRLYAGINNVFNEMYADSLDIDGDILYRAADERNYFVGINYIF
ncbi:TonB-dependent receptor [Cetobacterium sp. ZOR0034]|uniref:TonB-dependent receptor n=1 Tax=Cetobacterium sp. ZOR0034 TaxID=1339239 RepID=UPI000645A4FA|nr:TonB-dependent receptor [Cetobacterium sp. ZOR0034]